MSFLKEKIKVGDDTVYMFDPQIYPRKLWISVTTSQLEDRFKDIPEWNESFNADVNHTWDKVTNLGGLIIRFENLDEMIIPNIIHECNHVVFEIFNYCDVRLDFDNQEPFCYLSGWAAKCCEEVLTLEKHV